MSQAFLGPPERAAVDARRERAGPCLPSGAVGGGSLAMLRVRAVAPAGNRAISRLVATVQREDPPKSDQANDTAALVDAIALANKGSAFKVKISSRPQVPTSPLEIKKVGLEIDGTSEVIAPDVTSTRAPAKVAAGTQNTVTSEQPRSGLMETKARVYAAELTSRIPGLAETKVRDALKFKTNGEYRSGGESKAAAGVALDTEYVSAEVMINFLQVDLSAKNPEDRFKPLTATIKLGSGKLLEHTFPRLVAMAHHDLDVKLRCKISGVIEIGPRWQDLESDVIKRFGQKALGDYRTSMMKTLAFEESTLLADKLAEKIAREATENIADAEIREIAFYKAKQQALEAAGERGITKTMVDVMVAEVGKDAAAKTDLAAARTAMRMAAEAGAREAFELIGKSVVREAVKDALKLSARRLGAGLVGALVLGPVDIALVGVELIGSAVVEMIRSQQIKDVGMTAQLVRDNYVAGYRAGLVGGGGGSPGGAASSSAEGAAYLGGVGDGTKQFETSVDAALKDRPEVAAGTLSKADVVAQVKELMPGLDVSTAKIVTVAAPKLQAMLEAAYVKANSGGILNWVFGSDPRDTKAFKGFSEVVRTNLQPSATRTVSAKLANGVTLTLTSLDYTGENAKWFRTADGAHKVRMGGDTTTHSGWVTEEGTPLEDVYPNAAGGATADAGGPALEAKMAVILRGCRVRVFVRVSPSGTRTETLTVSNPEAKQIAFEQWMRSSPALATSLSAFNQLTVNVTYTPSDGHPATLNLYRSGAGVSSPGSDDPVNLKKFATELGIDPTTTALPQAVGSHLWSDRLAGTVLAVFPTPTILTV